MNNENFMLPVKRLLLWLIEKIAILKEFNISFLIDHYSLSSTYVVSL